MSSTNRGKPRQAKDYYVTPIPPIVDFLRAAQEDLGPGWTPKAILDPCAGGDSHHPMSYPTAFAQVWPDVPVTTIDTRQDSLAAFIGDSLASNLDMIPDFTCSNPPFGLAMEFINWSLKITNGYVAYLLRVNYFGSDGRFAWWKAHMPLYTYVHHKRMSFTPDGKTDSIEYCHCLWQPGNYPRFTQLRVI